MPQRIGSRITGCGSPPRMRTGRLHRREGLTQSVQHRQRMRRADQLGVEIEEEDEAAVRLRLVDMAGHDEVRGVVVPFTLDEAGVELSEAGIEIAHAFG